MRELGEDLVAQRIQAPRLERLGRTRRARRRRPSTGGRPPAPRRCRRARARRGRPRGPELGEQPRLAHAGLADAAPAHPTVSAPARRAPRPARRAPRCARRADRQVGHASCGEHNPDQGAGSGCRPDVAGPARRRLYHAAASSSTTATSRPSAACLRRLQRSREPAPPSRDARLLRLRRARDLVVGGGDGEQEALALLPFFVARARPRRACARSRSREPAHGTLMRPVSSSA